MTVQGSTHDNRRLVVRVLSQQVLQLLTDWARRNNEDLIAVLIFTTIWTANSAHIATHPALRYADSRDIPSDTVRRPVPLDDLPDMICLPRAIVAVYVRDLVGRGLIEATDAGLMVPSAVLARMDTLENLNSTYDHALSLFAALQQAGLQTGAAIAPNPN